MRAALRALPSVALPPRARPVVLGAVMVLALGALCVAAAGGYRAWSTRLNHDAWLAWRMSEVQRVASRYGEVRLPLRGETCTSYAFDNLSGWLLNEREAACEKPKPPRTLAAWEKSGGSSARAFGMASAFRR